MNQNLNLTDKDKHYLNTLLRSNKYLGQVLNKNQESDYLKDNFSDVNRHRLNNLLKRYIRKYKSKRPCTRESNLVHLDSGSYQYKNQEIRITTLLKLIMEIKRLTWYNIAYGRLIMYKIYQIVIKDKELNKDFEEWSFLGHYLYNETLYIIRNLFTGLNKDYSLITPNEEEVISNTFEALAMYDSENIIGSNKRVPSYTFLNYYLSKYRRSNNYESLPKHIAQHIIKQALGDFKNWLAALKDYKKNPSKYTGRPKMPGYKKDSTSFKISNQEAVIYKTKFGHELKLPRQKTRMPLSIDAKGKKLKEVTVSKYYNHFKLTLVMEEYYTPLGKDKTVKAAIDFGIDNIVAISTNNGKSLLVKGNVIKSKNQWFNKQLAKNLRGQTIGKDTKAISSKALNRIYMKRNNYMRDIFHKVSKEVITWCCKNDVGLIVLGRTKFWKQNINIGKANNQNFVQMPLYLLIQYIKDKAFLNGIEVLEQEESYTSKASFLDMDKIPVYKKGDNINYIFSGKRTKRGLYKDSLGRVINADLNGACNILRKAMPSEKLELNYIGYLTNPQVLDYSNIIG